MRAKALYDCTADDVGELSFKEGDILVDVTESKEDGWYEGRVQGTSVRGLFPYNYAEFIPEQQQPQPEPQQQSLTPSKAIPLDSTSDSSRTLFSSSVSPPNSTLSSTWSVISAKESSASTQDTSIETDAPSLRTDKGIDAFERAMMQQPTSFKNIGAVGKLAIEAQKPSVAPKPTQLIKKKPSLGSKKNTTLAMERLPTQPPLIPLTNAASPSVASRVRSLSTSATGSGADNAAPVKLPSLYSKQNDLADNVDNKTSDSSISRKAMPIIRPKPYTIKSTASHDNRPVLKKEQPERVIFDNPAANENEDDVEDVDGYQLVRPSQIRQRQGSMTAPKAMPTLARVNYKQQLPAMTSTASKQSASNNNNKPYKNQPSSLPSTLKSSSPLSSPSDNKLEGIPSANNPAPRLPSRPVSKASRRSQSSKTSALTSPDSVAKTSAKQPPETKPKPTQLATVVNSTPSQRSKGRSVSNPPPIQPKPFISKLNSSKPDVPIQSKPDGIRKPPPAPATASKTTPAVSLRQVAARREQWQQLPDNSKHSATDDDNEVTNVKPSEILMRTRSKSNGWTQPTQKDAPPVLPARTIAPKVETAVGVAAAAVAAKKTPPPPPPSRPVQSGPKVPARYEELFNAIHDEGYVDGQTARIVWKRSKVTDEALAKIWQQCDPQGSGLLDKNAFIQGMREIDALLGQPPK